MSRQMHAKTIYIGGASGYWGESAMATPQLLQLPRLDYLVYDYLAEITMSILARSKTQDETLGYATDFIDHVIAPHLTHIADKKVKIISNAGGVNPLACAQKIRTLIKAKGLNLKTAIITGDDLMAHNQSLTAQHCDMFTGAPFPEMDKIASNNAYLGGFGIAKALAMGADIVITGRCVDSALTLGPCIHEFGWQPTEWDKLACGSLAGHILECGPQATGGNFTDWQDVGDCAHIGYPVAEISNSGAFIVTKPEHTTGLVSVGTVSEQMLYEIGDPCTYILPDVICDFSNVKITQKAENRVHVSPAKGRPAPSDYKCCLSYYSGYRAGHYATFYGHAAALKAQKFGEAVLTRTRQKLRQFNLGELTNTSCELIGAGSQTGIPNPDACEIVLKLAVQHPKKVGTGIFLKEFSGMGLATPPGLSGFTGVRAKPSPVMKLFSYQLDKSEIKINIDMDSHIQTICDPIHSQATILPTRPAIPALPDTPDLSVPLYKLAWGRSGDKGDKANIGLIARQPDFLPYIWHGLSKERIMTAYRHFMTPESRIERFLLPGSHAMNILIDHILGGGGIASLRNDAQGKGYAQILLMQPIAIPPALASHIT